MHAPLRPRSPVCHGVGGRTSMPKGRSLATAALVAGSVLAGSALASNQVHATSSYRATIDGDFLVLETPAQKELVRWPLGATVTPTDPGSPVTPAPSFPSVVPVSSVENGVPVLTWTWPFASGPIAEQR